MIAININDIKYEITTEPTVEQWKSLMKYDFNDGSQWTAIVNELTGAPLDDLNSMDYDQKRLAVVMIAHGITERLPVKLTDFNELEFGQWIDCEYYLAMGLEKSIDQIVERLGYDTQLAQEALYIVETYMAWRESIYKQYSALFSYDDPDMDEIVEQNPKTAQEVGKGWYNILVDLAQENVLQIEPVTKLKIKEALNFMAVRKEKQLEEIRKQKQKQRNDLQRNRR